MGCFLHPDEKHRANLLPEMMLESVVVSDGQGSPQPRFLDR